MSILKVLALFILALALLMVASAHAGILPDLKVTPGVVNPNVTQANIHKTICVSGWTKTIRPHVAYTNALKHKLIKDLADKNLANYELDHDLSIEIGGDPRDPKNLWMQAYAGPCGARKKDVIETRLKTLICKGTVTLADAQKAITTNWVEAYRKYVGPLECGGGI